MNFEQIQRNKVFCRMCGLAVIEVMSLSGHLSNIDEIITFFNWYGWVLMFMMLAKYENHWLYPLYLFVLALNRLILLIQKNEKINILSLLFMPYTGNKSSGAIFGSYIWRLQISPASSE